MKITMKAETWKALACTAGGAALVGVTAGAAAPLIGAWVGSTFLGLSGAAATSAGLATLGGGSLATGGLGMAGGTTVVGLIGAVSGAGVGALGAVATSAMEHENCKSRRCIKCVGEIDKEFSFCHIAAKQLNRYEIMEMHGTVIQCAMHFCYC